MSAQPDLPPETADQRAVAEVAEQQHELGKQLRPVRNDLFKRISDYRQEMGRIKGQANADAQQAAGGATVTPNRPGASVNQAIALGNTVGRTNANAQDMSKDARVQSLQGLSGIARGQQKVALAGINDVAQNSQARQFMGAREDAQRRNQIGSLALGAIGAGANAYINRKPALGSADAFLQNTNDDQFKVR